MEANANTPRARRFTTSPCRPCGTVTSVLVVGERVRSERITPRIVDNCGTGNYLEVFASGAGGEVLIDNGSALVTCRGCGAEHRARPVHGRLKNSVACDARCTGAKGHNCECSCGGKNHGSDHAA